MLFSLYTTPLRKAICYHSDIDLHFYVDYVHLYVHLTHKNAAHVFDRLKTCLDDVKQSLLKLNPDKTEFIIFDSKMQCEKLKSFPVNILANFLSPAEAVRNLCVWLIVIFSFQGISRTSVSLALFKSGILSVSEAISQVM